MQENADWTMSCISIFANIDSFAEGMIYIEILFLISFKSLDKLKLNETNFSLYLQICWTSFMGRKVGL